jgi:CheY-like chemotaxis protein
MNSRRLVGESSLRHISRNGKNLILSVDDDPGILFTRHKLLESAGYRVLSAADGEEALKIFESNPVDLVLLDFYMPGMDGTAVAKELKRRNHTLPIIIVSASPLADQDLVCADSLVKKGEGPELLFNQIHRLLSQRPRQHGVKNGHASPVAKQKASHQHIHTGPRRPRPSG